MVQCTALTVQNRRKEKRLSEMFWAQAAACLQAFNVPQYQVRVKSKGDSGEGVVLRLGPT